MGAENGDKLGQSGNGFLLVGAQQAWFCQVRTDVSDPERNFSFVHDFFLSGRLPTAD
jgi:hypothetical protein